jgi:methylthioribose-1-phosphate isomerase
MLSVLAKENNIPFYTVAPTSTIDLAMPTGDQVPIEERSGDEVRTPYGNSLIPENYSVRNPAFDVTPQRYLAGVITEYGIALPPFKETLPRMVERSQQPAVK